MKLVLNFFIFLLSLSIHLVVAHPTKVDPEARGILDSLNPFASKATAAPAPPAQNQPQVACRCTVVFGDKSVRQILAIFAAILLILPLSEEHMLMIHVVYYHKHKRRLNERHLRQGQPQRCMHSDVISWHGMFSRDCK
jgi:hypothetical protein